MFYVKTKIGDATVQIDITDYNVLTRCPDCGKEFGVDMSIAVDEDGMLDFEAQPICRECALKHWHKVMRKIGLEEDDESNAETDNHGRRSQTGDGVPTRQAARHIGYRDLGQGTQRRHVRRD